VLLARLCCVAMVGSVAVSAHQQDGAVDGSVVDQIGAQLTATVTLLQYGVAVDTTDTDAEGEFQFDDVPSGRYHIEGRADGFERSVSGPVFVGAGATASVLLMLRIGPIEQYVVVTAAAAALPQSQSGSPVTVVSRNTLERLAKADVIEALRLVPGVSLAQTGGRGGTSSVFIRGGAADFNKVLIDGIPANDIGGAFDWETVGAVGIEQIEVLRTANSVAYGADALGGVISLTTRRGQTRTPELTYALDGGSFGTVRNELSLGGVVNRFDYFLDVSRFDTDNEVPNNAFHNDTIAGRFGVVLGTSTDVSFTVRRIETDSETPGAVLFNGVADDSSQTNDLTHFGVTARSQVTSRLRTDLQFASTDRAYRFENPSPTGEPFDPFGFGANYLGEEVTVVGANNYETTGRAILDFGGLYPSIFDAKTTRRFVSGTADYQLTPALDIAAGVHLDREEGTSGTTATTERTNAGSFVEASASLTNRVYLTGGVGFEHNDLFGYATTPRLSVALYLRPPTRTDVGVFGDTKLTFNAGRGIKAPGVFDEQSSLFTLLADVSGGGDPSATAGVEQIGPERSRNLDVGIEQALGQGRVRLRAAYFDNEFSDLVEFVSSVVLPQLGVPTDVAAAVPFGATVNASSYRARGLETSADVRAGDLQAVVSYMFLDAEVSESFSDGALNPSVNPEFPGIVIGQFSPLIGARPFRRPAHSGSLLLSYVKGPGQISLAGYFVGKSDDSTFLSDAFFGPSLLLPNQNLLDGYQKVDLSGSYRVHPRLRWYVSLENLLDETYTATAGFPALSRTFRSGFSVTLGGP